VIARFELEVLMACVEVVVNYGGEATHTEGLMAVLAEENDIRCEIYLS